MSKARLLPVEKFVATVSDFLTEGSSSTIRTNKRFEKIQSTDERVADGQSKSPRIMKGRPFEGKFSWVVVATEFTSGRSTP